MSKLHRFKKFNALQDEGNYIWAGTDGGLTKLNKATGEITCYNKTNSGLPDNYIQAIAFTVMAIK